MILLLVILKGCNMSSMDIRQEDFVGVWKSIDGSVIEFKKDGSYIAKKINYNVFYPNKEFEKMTLDFTGNWKIINNSQQDNKLELNSNATFSDFGINDTYTIDGEDRSHKIGLSFEISGEGILENKPPYYLFIWLGDPDDMNKYKFIKE